MQTTTSADTAAHSFFREAAGLVTATLGHWTEVVFTKLPNLVVAILVLAVFWLVARTVRNNLRKGLLRTQLTAPIISLVTTMVGVAVVAMGLFVSLGVMGLDKTVASLLAGVGILGFVLGFAFQEVAANFVAGIILSVRQSFALGQVIGSNDIVGTVRHISLQSTTIEQFTGEMVWLPNRSVVGTPLVNFSATGQRRVDLDFRVAYGHDMEEVRGVALGAIELLDCRRKDLPLDLFYTSFGDSYINFTIRFWADFARQPDYLGARSEAMIAITKAFEREGISIPFPRRTLDFSAI